MIETLFRDELTGQRVGRCGDWYVRSRGRNAFDVVPRDKFGKWDDVPSDYSGLLLDQAARMLGVPQGDLYNWGAER